MLPNSMSAVLRACYMLIFIGYQASAADITGVNVKCNENDNITVTLSAKNSNITSAWAGNCTFEYPQKTFTLNKNCSSVQMDKITFVTINVNNTDNTTLAIQCPAATVYRIADGTEFSRHNMQYEIGDVDMSFKTGISAQSEDISRVYLGDQFYMIMEYIGQSNYTIVPQKCTVYEGNIASGNGVEIWNNNACVLNIGLTVMENFNYTDDGRLYAKMYGFRFNKNDIHDITVKCDLTLCLPGKVSPDKVCGIKKCGSTRSYKKRRATSKSLRIIQAYRTQNGACRNRTLTIWFLSIVVSWLFMDVH